MGVMLRGFCLVNIIASVFSRSFILHLEHQVVSQVMKRGLHTLSPENKQKSINWRHSGSPWKTKFKQTLSARKVMCTMFWDRRGVLLVDFSTRGETVNAERYSQTLQKLRRSIQNKRHWMLSAGVVLLQDNARPHKTRRDGQHISCRRSAGRYSIIYHIDRTSRPAISIFSYASRNPCPGSVFKMRDRRR